jgi:hypothetical protein
MESLPKLVFVSKNLHRAAQPFGDVESHRLSSDQRQANTIIPKQGVIMAMGATAIADHEHHQHHAEHGMTPALDLGQR